MSDKAMDLAAHIRILPGNWFSFIQTDLNFWVSQPHEETILIHKIVVDLIDEQPDRSTPLFYIMDTAIPDLAFKYNM